ncbi:MAG: hypothetical protein CMI31_01715 [Opitutae bacterium]|nr:hypothetical protein [Opitutae bacterium]
MQTSLCILGIALTLILFGIGMVRQDSENTQSIESIEAMLRESRGSPTSFGNNSTVVAEVEESPAPQAKEKVKVTLMIELPTTNNPRSSSESFSIKESYLYLHQEFGECDIFFEHIVKKISGDQDTKTLLAGSLANGPISLAEILRNRLFFRVEGTVDGNKEPLLALEAFGESVVAAKRLVQIAQIEYLRLIARDDASGFHPKLVELAERLKKAVDERNDLENDLVAFTKLNKTPSSKQKADEIKILLENCRDDKSSIADNLRKIATAFSNNSNDIMKLADLKALIEFPKIRMLRENWFQLEESTKKYRLEGKASVVSAHQKTAQEIRVKLKKEIHVAIATMKKRLQELLEQEITLNEQLLETQHDFAELSLKYPKANQLLAARRSVVALEKELKSNSTTWRNARNQLVIGDLSKDIPPSQLQNISP